MWNEDGKQQNMHSDCWEGILLCRAPERPLVCMLSEEEGRKVMI